MHLEEGRAHAAQMPPVCLSSLDLETRARPLLAQASKSGLSDIYLDLGFRRSFLGGL